ncbi:hypothetical protein NESM_000166300 [Novymonas esmeraldas]|uniref:Uncharacterized protein n=1 Tax=Novymonas esmeraldas TaxID=1808958 RepID=A0AAW0F7J7_9TRYP
MWTRKVSEKQPMRSDCSSMRSVTASPGPNVPCDGEKRNLLEKSVSDANVPCSATTAAGAAAEAVAEAAAEAAAAAVGSGGMITY